MTKLLQRALRPLCAALLTLALLLGTTALPAQAEGTPMTTQAFVEGVQALVSRHWPHMQKVWPGADYTQHPLVLVYMDDSDQVQEGWTLGTGGMKPLAKEAAAALPVPQAGGYANATVDGKPAIVMSIDSLSLTLPGEVEQVYRTATHELVHFYHQAKMDMSEGGSRAQAYPVEQNPRYYRQMMYRNMIAAWDNPDNAQELLSQARYWQDRWQQEFPKEATAIRNTDIVEGIAKYMENLGAVLVDGITPEARDQEATQAIQRAELFPSADGESYELGYVAALLLDRQQPGWKADFYATGQSPMELLLAGFEPRQQADDAEIRKLVTEEIDTINTEAERQLQGILTARKDAGIPWVKVDITDVQSSYEARGNYLVNGDDVVTGFAAQYTVGSGMLRLRDASVIMLFTEEGRMCLLVPLTMEHEVKDGVLNLRSLIAEAQNVPVQAAKEGNMQMYLVKAAD